MALAARGEADKAAARQADERARAESKAAAALESRAAAERRAEARASARSAAESAAADALRARLTAEATFSADAARSADAAGRAEEVHRTLSDLRKQLPRRFFLWVPAAIAAAVVLGYLWASRPQGNVTLAEPLQLRLEHSLATDKP